MSLPWWFTKESPFYPLVTAPRDDLKEWWEKIGGVLAIGILGGIVGLAGVSYIWNRARQA